MRAGTWFAAYEAARRVSTASGRVTLPARGHARMADPDARRKRGPLRDASPLVFDARGRFRPRYEHDRRCRLGGAQPRDLESTSVF